MAQATVLEDFEGDDGTITWEAVNGTYNGIVDNPEDTTGRNSSPNVGSYTKSGEHTFSLFRGNLSDSLDLATNNRITLQLYAGAPTAFILKFVGNDGAVEMRKNIATANAWRTYEFDFSGRAELMIGRVEIFFDPGVLESVDTYLFDNLRAQPAGPCAGTEVDPTVIDDFECQRNATYGVPGFDDIEVIANPDKSGINTSDSVAQYTDREGRFHALVIDYEQAIDLSDNNNICFKIWAPEAGDVLVKLQDGPDGVSEKPVTVGEAMTWTEVCVSFADVADNDYGQLVLFINYLVADAAGDVYYLDDLTLTPTPAAEPLEDFEGGANLSWGPLNDDAALNGAFATIVNPDQSAPNTSATVGSYTRGSSLFSTLTAALPGGLDLSGNPQINLDVWAPADAVTVTLQLVSATSGPKNAEATVAAAQTWQTLSFNFADFADVTDFERINLLFAPNSAGAGLYLFDNLVQGQATVDACADVQPDPNVLDDFECQRNASYTVGAEFLTVIDNPDDGEDSPNRSTRVGAFAEQPGEFNALSIDYGQEFDLRIVNQLSASVWSPVEGQLLFKLEGDGVPGVERYIDIDTTDAWSTYSADFSGVGAGYTRAVLFFNVAVNNTTVDTFYVDNVRLGRAAYVSSCVSNFDTLDFSVTEWQYFANGSNNDNQFLISENPDSSGTNPSAFVGTFEEAADGQQDFAGIFAVLDAPVALPNDNKTVSIKVFMTVAGTITLKLENNGPAVPDTPDNDLEYDTPGEWQELVFDFTDVVPDGQTYDQITLLMNRSVTPDADLVHYFDDIAVGGGDCSQLVSIFNPVPLADLRAYPNPIDQQLTIDNPERATSLSALTNMLGQRVKTLVDQGAGTQVQWPLADLAPGTYLLTAQDQSGKLVARTKVVKR